MVMKLATRQGCSSPTGVAISTCDNKESSSQSFLDWLRENRVIVLGVCLAVVVLCAGYLLVVTLRKRRKSRTHVVPSRQTHVVVLSDPLLAKPEVVTKTQPRPS
jgi:hypothetical protein